MFFLFVISFISLHFILFHQVSSTNVTNHKRKLAVTVKSKRIILSKGLFFPINSCAHQLKGDLLFMESVRKWKKFWNCSIFHYFFCVLVKYYGIIQIICQSLLLHLLEWLNKKLLMGQVPVWKFKCGPRIYVTGYRTWAGPR